ncbi:S-layer homology domain-containing protein [Paenibacillus dokdonensis]|uniref:S-layer homology domain-containing protein n=1 Tax=Paenibacillus dokdonensis TaxID=2567944 RepID=UPI0010A94A94|nr:S-layer homology domain-containing protein [Paenibacillus dokdonensis]
MYFAKRIGILFLSLSIIAGLVFIKPIGVVNADTSTPLTATIVFSNPSLTIGQTSTVTITFTEAVRNFTVAALTVMNGTLSGLSPSDGMTWTATFTPVGNTYATSNFIALNMEGVQDSEGHSGSGTIHSGNYSINTIRSAPSVVSVAVPANGIYGTGQNLDFTVQMSEPVNVTGTPQIALVIGTTTVQAVYVSGSGTNALLFRYTVQAGQEDTDGITMGALALNGGSIQSVAGNHAVLLLNSVGSTTNVLVSTTAPAIQNVNVPVAGTYKTGNSLDFTVTMSKNVTVSGTPQLTLDIGGVKRTAPLIGMPSSNNTLQFRYMVQSGDHDNDGITIEALTLNGGSIKDGLGNDADLTLRNVGSTAGVLIDTTLPTITGYVLGKGNAYIDVTFSEGVFADDHGAGALTPGNLRLNFDKNGGSATGAAIHSLKRTDGGNLTGGETVIRVMLDIVGIPSGQESIEVVPADGASMYNLAGNAVESTQSTGKVRLLDMRAPVVIPPTVDPKPDPGPQPTHSTSSQVQSGSQEEGIALLANGLLQKNMFTVTTQTVNGVKTTVMKMDEAKINALLQQADAGYVLINRVTNHSDHVISELSALLAMSLEAKGAVLEVQTENAVYRLPVQQIPVQSLPNLFGPGVALQDIRLRVEITHVPANQVSFVPNQDSGIQLVSPAVDFKIIAEHNGKEVMIEKFNAYVERMIAIPAGTDPSQITTGVIMMTDGSMKQVPTKVIQVDGKWFAVMNSMTNSTYALIHNSKTFDDIASHWARKSIEDLASRLVINGVNENSYVPNEAITRAEFTAIVTRALGLRLADQEMHFRDVHSGDWFYNAVQVAVSYGLIQGYGDDSFKPDQRITREEAMVMISKVMDMTKRSTILSMEQQNELLASFRDQAEFSTWARNGAALNIQYGIIQGDQQQAHPGQNITRAETAAIVERLLQALKLI